MSWFILIIYQNIYICIESFTKFVTAELLHITFYKFRIMKTNCKLLALLPLLAFGACNHSTQPDYFKPRRDHYAAEAAESVSVIHGAAMRGGLNKNFFYLTGSEDTTAVLVINPADPANMAVLYSDFPELNVGLGMPVIEKSQLNESLQGIFQHGKAIKMESDRGAQYQRMMHNLPFSTNADSIIFTMRMVKDAGEIDQLRKACRYTAEGINYMMRNLKPGMTEIDMDSLMQNEFARLGADGISFNQAASGHNATSTHAGVTAHVLGEDEMAVIDIGALSGKYTADISRSFPISGEFNPQQREIYEIVLLAQREGMKHFLPGNNMLAGEELANDLIIDELYKLGLVTDKESPWQRKFYIQHGFGHHIGLDIHDVWYWFQRVTPKEERIYQPGMVLTFEPGLYFPDDYLMTLPERLKDSVSQEELHAFIEAVEPFYHKYKGIGVRIEECVLITEDGQEILTDMSPIDLSEIETLMQSGTN